VDDDGAPVHPSGKGPRVMKASDNLETVLNDAGFTLSDVVRLNYFVTDVDGFIEVAQVDGPRLGQANSALPAPCLECHGWRFQNC